MTQLNTGLPHRVHVLQPLLLSSLLFWTHPQLQYLSDLDLYVFNFSVSDSYKKTPCVCKVPSRPLNKSLLATVTQYLVTPVHQSPRPPLDSWCRHLQRLLPLKVLRSPSYGLPRFTGKLTRSDPEDTGTTSLPFLTV